MLRSGLPEPLAQHPAAGVPLLLATTRENKQDKNYSKRPKALRTKPPLQRVDPAIWAGCQLHQRLCSHRFAHSSLLPAQVQPSQTAPFWRPNCHCPPQVRCHSGRGTAHIDLCDLHKHPGRAPSHSIALLTAPATRPTCCAVCGQLPPKALF